VSVSSLYKPVDAPDSSRPNLMGVVLRETARPFRRTWNKWQKWRGDLHEASLRHFRFDRGTVEPEGLEFLGRLVEASQKFSGPIVEIGTLFGFTATHIALNKGPHQKIITVDTYGWNPWRLSRKTHFELTSRILHYLVQTGQVEQRKQKKSDFYSTYSGPPPSLVFLDCIHSYEETKKDIEWAKSVGAAMICGHDYSDEFPGVQRVVKEYGGPKEVGGTVFLLP